LLIPPLSGLLCLVLRGYALTADEYRAMAEGLADIRWTGNTRNRLLRICPA